MALPNIKDTQGALLVGIEAAAGVEETLTAANAVAFLDAQWEPNPDNQNDREQGGGLGAGRMTTGAFRPTIRIATKLRATGNPATDPDFDPLLRMSALVKTTLSAAIPSSGVTPCRAGSSISQLVLDRSIDTQWPATSGALAGHPIEISGSLAGGAISGHLGNAIQSYTVAGSTVTIILAKKLPTAANTSTNVKRPLCKLWQPGSPDPLPSGTIHRFTGPGGGGISKRARFVGVRGDMQMTFAAGREARLSFPMGGKLPIEDELAIPAGINLTLAQAPTWQGGAFAINAEPIGLSSLTLQAGNLGFFDQDPNASDGLGEYDLGTRDVRLSCNPKLALGVPYDYLKFTRENTLAFVYALIGAEQSGAAGSRWSLLVPSVQFADAVPASDGPLARRNLSAQGTGFSNEFTLAQY